MTADRIDPSRIPLEGLGRAGEVVPARKPGTAEVPGDGFDRVLRERISGLKFSAHAEERLKRRNIALEPAELERLKGAVDRAAAKGCCDSLVLVDDKAFVVSVKNRTVITAVDGQSVREGVFTNIDSAVVS